MGPIAFLPIRAPELGAMVVGARYPHPPFTAALLLSFTFLVNW
jgi:hypothetical protein